MHVTTSRSANIAAQAKICDEAEIRYRRRSSSGKTKCIRAVQYVNSETLMESRNRQIKMVAGIHIVVNFLVGAAAVALVLNVAHKRPARAAFAGSERREHAHTAAGGAFHRQI